MEFAYLDESGDVGANGSKKLVVCLMCTSEKKKLARIIRKSKQRLLEKNKTARWLNQKGEIKFYSFPDKHLLMATLKELSKTDIKIYYNCFNKKGKNFDISLKKKFMGHLFWHIFEIAGKIKPQSIIADLDFLSKTPSYFVLLDYKKRKVKLLDKDGHEKDAAEGKISFDELSKEDYDKYKDDNSKFLIRIEPKNSRLDEALQALDLICGSIFQLLENDNPEYYNIIKGKVIIGNIE